MKKRDLLHCPAGRPLELRDARIEGLVAPRSVAVVGASEKNPQRGQWLMVKNNLEARGARVVPVHPTRAEIAGTPAFPSLQDVPFEIDVAVILTRDPQPILEECIRIGVKFAVVFAAGFNELGTDEGRERQAQIEALGRGPMRILGPNTNMNLFERWRVDLAGPKLALISHSGHQVRPVAFAEHLGIPIHSWAPLGNEADFEVPDFLAYYAEHAEVGAIAAYVEGFRDGRTLMLAANRALRHRTPIVLVKIGRTSAGRRMASTHTGHEMGSDPVYDAVFRQLGITRVDDVDMLREVSIGMLRLPLLPGRRVGIYAISGGTTTHLAELCGAAGLEVPELEAQTVEKLRKLIPGYLRVDNPVDSGGGITLTPDGRQILEALAFDANTDLTLVGIMAPLPGFSETLITHIVEAHERKAKPIAVVWAWPDHADPGYRILVEAGVPLFHSGASAAKAFRARADFAELALDYQDPFALIPRDSTPERSSALALIGDGQVDAKSARRLLELYGIPVHGEEPHTTETDPSGSAALCLRITQERPFGAVISCRFAGPLGEALGAPWFGVPPFTERDARRMLEELHGSALLRGDARRPAVDVDALVDCLMSLQRLAVDLGDRIGKLELDPVIVHSGNGGIAVEQLRFTRRP